MNDNDFLIRAIIINYLILIVIYRVIILLLLFLLLLLLLLRCCVAVAGIFASSRAAEEAALISPFPSQREPPPPSASLHREAVTGPSTGAVSRQFSETLVQRLAMAPRLPLLTEHSRWAWALQRGRGGCGATLRRAGAQRVLVAARARSNGAAALRRRLRVV